VIWSRDLREEDKEALVQKAAISVAGSTMAILGRVALCLLIPAFAVWLGKQAGAYSTADIWAAASNWVFIAASSALMIAAWAVMRRHL
jgi:hypothetical protein